LWPDVFAWGVLLLPKDLKPGERRPVVVCQHGLEGVPADTITLDPKAGGFGPYQGFSARLAERGFIVFAPHNPYRGRDAFRVLQRKANPLGRSLFSVIVAQHERILEWLAAQPFVDPERIAFYGLSYGARRPCASPRCWSDTASRSARRISTSGC
jgi:dienelactone hydrolase